MRRVWLLPLFTLAFSGMPADAAVFNAKTAMMPNGLQVVVVENHMAPVVTHMMWIKAGAADEGQGVSGIAHYLEHLMFKGTATVPNGEYSSRIAQVGGTENAFTSWDYTAFFATVAKANLPMVMELEADRLAHLQIKKDLATPELAVVLDERRQRVEDEPFAPLMQQMAAALFPHHPYGTPVIGWKEEIEKFTVDDAKHFYDTWYQPSNTVVVVSGDVNAADVFALAKKTFGALPTKVIPPRSRAIDPPFKGNATIVLENQHVRETTILRTFKVKAARLDPAFSLALQVLEELLDGSDASFLSKRLIQEKNLASGVNVSYESDVYDNGQYSISLVPKPNVTSKQLLDEMDVALREYVKKVPSDEDMKAAKLGLQRQAVLARDSVMGPAQTIGLALTTGQSLEDVENWPEQIGAVTPQQVQQALQTLLDTPSVTGILKPKEGRDPNAPPPAPPPVMGVAHPMKRILTAVIMVATIALPNIAHANDVQIFKSSKGITAWLIEDHSLPIVSMSFTWHGGIESDPDNKQGLSHIAATMLSKGAGGDDENAFMKKLQDNAISLSYQAQRDNVYGQFRSLKETLPLAQQLLRASVMSPRFDDQSLATVKAQNISAIKTYQADPDWLMSRLMIREIFNGHPYSKRTLGTQETVTSITKDDLKKWHDHLSRDKLLVAVTGDVTKDELGTLLDQTFGDLPEKTAQTETPKADLQGKTQTFLLNYAGPQSSMTLVWPGIFRHDKDWYAAEVMNYILGGGSFSSRLMSEVREKRGLTYGISSGMSLYDQASSYTIQASFKNENAGDVLNLVKQEITKMRDTKVTAAEMKAAKDYLIGSYPLSLTSTTRVAGHYLEIQREHLGVDAQQTREAGIKAVTADDVQRVAKRILVDDAQVSFFVGQPKGITATKTFDGVE